MVHVLLHWLACLLSLTLSVLSLLLRALIITHYATAFCLLHQAFVLLLWLALSLLHWLAFLVLSLLLPLAQCPLHHTNTGTDLVIVSRKTFCEALTLFKCALVRYSRTRIITHYATAFCLLHQAFVLLLWLALSLLHWLACLLSLTLSVLSLLLPLAQCPLHHTIAGTDLVIVTRKTCCEALTLFKCALVRCSKCLATCLSGDNY